MEHMSFGECHGHIFMDGVSFRQAYALHEGGVDESDLHRKLAEYAEAGVTFFRDGGDALGVSERARRLAGAYGLDYRTPVFAIHRQGHYGRIVGRGYETLEEYRALVREAGERGADFIKIMISGLVDFTGERELSEASLEEGAIGEMIGIAHEQGFAVMAHANGPEAILAAARAGVDSIEHGNFMSDAALLVMKEQGTIWVPTIATISNLLRSGRYPLRVIRALLERQSGYLKKAWDLGIPIALGSDAGAYRVSHVFGIEDEALAMERIFGDTPAVWERFSRAQRLIQERFRSGRGGL